jgi:hypothetical protein
MSSILKVDTIQDQSGNNIINENADTITIGASGDTITIPSGATLTNNGTQTGLTLSDNILFNTSSKGIYLGVTTATASNLLDDYEEGTWSPVISGATGVTNLQGSYTKVGNLVTVWLQMLNGNVGGSPSYTITGLPFTVDVERATTSSIASNLFASNATTVYGLLDTSLTSIVILYNVNNNDWLTQNIRTTANGYLHFSASYIAN